MTVLTFQPRFCQLVAARIKLHTVRGERKRPIKVGDRLSLRRWSGRPYASKQETLRESVCVETAEVQIAGEGVTIDGRALNISESVAFAKADGFATYSDLVSWFLETHGLPFRGVLIRWEP